MIYWMAGHTTRFKALVAHDGMFNPLSFAGSTEELWFPSHEFGGTQLAPAARAVMEKWSPANYVGRWSTPMLIVHSQNDYRVDLSEGLQAFTALRLRAVPPVPVLPDETIRDQAAQPPALVGHSPRLWMNTWRRQRYLLVRWAINAIALFAAVNDSRHAVRRRAGQLMIVALVFGIVNAFVRPILTILSCPSCFSACSPW
jgi:hypothetical protein